MFGRAPRALLLGRSWSWSQKAGAPKRGSAYVHLKQLRLLCSTPEVLLLASTFGTAPPAALPEVPVQRSQSATK